MLRPLARVLGLRPHTIRCLSPTNCSMGRKCYLLSIFLQTFALLEASKRSVNLGNRWTIIFLIPFRIMACIRVQLSLAHILALVTKTGVFKLSFIKKQKTKSMFHWEINNSRSVQKTGLDFNNLQSAICSNYKLYIQFIIMTGWCQVGITGQERHPESTLVWKSHWVLSHSEQVTVQAGERACAIHPLSDPRPGGLF